MKVMKKLLGTLLVLSLACSILALAVFAESYTGTVEKLTANVEAIDTAEDTVAAIKLAEDYALTVDPTANGLSDVLATLTAKEKAKLEAILELSASKTDYSGKEGALNDYLTLLAVCDTARDKDGFAAIKTKADAEAAAAIDLGLSDIAAAEDFSTGCDIAASYNSLTGLFPDAYAAANVAEKEKTAVLALLTLGLDEIEEKSDVADLYLQSLDYQDLCALFPAISEDASLAEKETSSFTKALKSALPSLDPEGQIALNRIHLNKFSYIIKRYGLTDSQLLADFEAAKAEQDEASQKARDMAESTIPFDEYGWTTDYTSDFNGGGKLPTHGNAGKDGRNVADREIGLDGENGYYIVKYVETEVAGNVTTLNTYASFGLTDTTKGMVFEFSLTTFGKLPNKSLTFSSGENKLTGSGRAFPNFGTVTPQGVLKNGRENAEDLFGGEIAIVPGEWLKLSIVYNPIDYTVDLYVDNEYITTYSCAYDGNYKLTGFRMGCTPTSGEFAIDDVMMYAGTGLRTPGKLDSMTDEELFNYYVMCMSNPDFDDKVRISAYDRSAELIGNWWDGENETYLTEDAAIKANVDAFLTFPREELLNKVKADTLAEYVALCDELFAIERNLDTQTERSTALKKAEDYLSKNLAFMLINDQYNAYTERINEARSAINVDANISIFITAINRFKNASSVNTKQKHYDTAKDTLGAGVDLTLLNDEHPLREAYTAFYDAYQIYLNGEELIKEAEKEENSKKIVSCVNFLRDFGTDRSVWEENYDEMNRYVIIVRRIVRAEALMYNPDYEGVGEAVEIFEVLDTYFYNVLQLSHVEAITAKLGEFDAATSYVDKIGIVSYIERYLDSNDVDYTREDIDAVYQRYLLAEEAVKDGREDYDNILAANSQSFIAAVEELKAATNYVQRKAAFDKALGYYYVMNMGDEAVAEALKVFDEAEDMLAVVEETSEGFMETAALIEITEDRAELFALLVTASELVSGSDSSIEGMAEAIAAYQTANNAYTGTVTTVNGELAKTVEAVGAVRSSTSFADILATLIANILG